MKQIEYKKMYKLLNNSYKHKKYKNYILTHASIVYVYSIV